MPGFRDDTEIVFKPPIDDAQKPTYCSRCNSTGWVVMRVKQDGRELQPYASRCTCMNGDRLSQWIMRHDTLINRLGWKETHPGLVLGCRPLYALRLLCRPELLEPDPHDLAASSRHDRKPGPGPGIG